MTSYARFMHVDVTILEYETEATYNGEQDKGACFSRSDILYQCLSSN